MQLCCFGPRPCFADKHCLEQGCCHCRFLCFQLARTPSAPQVCVLQRPGHGDQLHPLLLHADEYIRSNQSCGILRHACNNANALSLPRSTWLCGRPEARILAGVAHNSRLGSLDVQIDKQAEDRCHRLGQTRPVTVHKLVSRPDCNILHNQWG